MVFNCVFVTFPCGILGQVWYYIISIPDLCRLSYFYMVHSDIFMRCTEKHIVQKYHRRTAILVVMMDGRFYVTVSALKANYVNINHQRELTGDLQHEM